MQIPDMCISLSPVPGRRLLDSRSRHVTHAQTPDWLGWCSWLSRVPHTHEVTSSILVPSTFRDLSSSSHLGLSWGDREGRGGQNGVLALFLGGHKVSCSTPMYGVICVQCVYVSDSVTSSWSQIARSVIPMLEKRKDIFMHVTATLTRPRAYSFPRWGQDKVESVPRFRERSSLRRARGRM